MIKFIFVFISTVLLLILNCRTAEASLFDALKIVGSSNPVTGPNCWNYALYSAGLVDSIRNVDDTEFHFLIESPLCQKLSGEATYWPGQIGVIRDQESYSHIKENHAFVYLTPNKILTKNGPFRESVYELTSLQKLLQISAFHLGPGRFLSRYQCTSLSSYFRDKKINPHLLKIAEIKIKFEVYYANVIRKKENLSIQFKNEILTKINKELAILKTDLKQGLLSWSEDERLFINILSQHFIGIAGQLYYTHASPIMDEFEELSPSLLAMLNGNK
jgi:hypothetical protein